MNQTNGNGNGNGKAALAVIGAAGTIATFIGLIVAGIGSGYVRELNAQSAELSQQRGLFSQLDHERGEMAARVHALEEAVSKLDTDLQREMRLLNTTTDAKTDGIDRRLQGEFQAGIAGMNAVIAELGQKAREHRDMILGQEAQIRVIEEWKRLQELPR